MSSTDSNIVSGRKAEVLTPWVPYPGRKFVATLAEFETALEVLKLSRNTDIIFYSPEEYGVLWHDRSTNQSLKNIVTMLSKYNNNRLKIVLGTNPTFMNHNYTVPALCTNNIVEVEAQNVDDFVDKSVIPELGSIAEIFWWPTYWLSAAFGKFLELSPVDFELFFEHSQKQHQLQKLFAHLSGRPHWHRCYTMDLLAKHKLINRNHVSWLRTTLESETQYEFDHWQEKPLSPSGDNPHFINQFTTPDDGYHNTLFDIVGESDPDHIFWTEKTVRPLVSLKPFVILGGRYTNAKLQEHGFQLYDELFDYEFDCLPTYKQRAHSLVSQIAYIQKTLPARDYLKVYNLLLPKIKHNFGVLAKIALDSNAIPLRETVADFHGKYEQEFYHNETMIYHKPIIANYLSKIGVLQ